VKHADVEKGENTLRKQRARRRNIILAVLLLPALPYLMVQAVYSGMAYVQQYHLNATLDQWGKTGAIQPLDEWMKVEKKAQAALHGNAYKVEITNALGRLYFYRSVRMSTARKHQLAFGHKAMAYFREVNRLRPAWPYGWMNLALIKFMLGERDEEFKAALQQLLRLGPWEKNTLPALIPLAVYAWPALTAAQRQPLLEYFTIAQKERAKDVLDALTASRQLSYYCAIVRRNGEKASFCPS